MGFKNNLLRKRRKEKYSYTTFPLFRLLFRVVVGSRRRRRRRRGRIGIRANRGDERSFGSQVDGKIHENSSFHGRIVYNPRFVENALLELENGPFKWDLYSLNALAWKYIYDFFFIPQRFAYTRGELRVVAIQFLSSYFRAVKYYVRENTVLQMKR